MMHKTIIFVLFLGITLTFCQCKTSDDPNQPSLNDDHLVAKYECEKVFAQFPGDISEIISDEYSIYPTYLIEQLKKCNDLFPELRKPVTCSLPADCGGGMFRIYI
jgi:hypothetical protein